MRLETGWREVMTRIAGRSGGSGSQAGRGRGAQAGFGPLRVRGKVGGIGSGRIRALPYADLQNKDHRLEKIKDKNIHKFLIFIEFQIKNSFKMYIFFNYAPDKQYVKNGLNNNLKKNV